MTPLFDEKRIDAAARFIADELKLLLDRNIDSHMSRRIREACQAYKDGLTNGERSLATLRALAMAQIEIGHDLASQKITDWDDIPGITDEMALLSQQR